MQGFNGMGLGMGVGWIIGLFILFIIIWAIPRAINKSNYPNKSGISAFDILKKRYARGEINKEQYEQTKSDIL